MAIEIGKVPWASEAKNKKYRAFIHINYNYKKGFQHPFSIYLEAIEKEKKVYITRNYGSNRSYLVAVGGV